MPTLFDEHDQTAEPAGEQLPTIPVAEPVAAWGNAPPAAAVGRQQRNCWCNDSCLLRNFRMPTWLAQRSADAAERGQFVFLGMQLACRAGAGAEVR
eukprot:3170471-Rhodomonas_salina.1